MTHPEYSQPEGAPTNQGGRARGLDVTEASRLLDELGGGHIDLARITEFFSVNPALGAEAIKRSNSAVHFRSAATANVRQAVLRLGSLELYDIIFKARQKQNPDGAGSPS